jgi:uncharacterized membrane protein
MPEQWLSTLTLVAAVGCGIVAGAFYAFSSFVMGALAKLPAPQGIAAMQSINVVVINPWFMTPFVGTAVLCLGLVVTTFFTWQRPGTGWMLAGALSYFLGTFVVTIALNVPRKRRAGRGRRQLGRERGTLGELPAHVDDVEHRPHDRGGWRRWSRSCWRTRVIPHRRARSVDGESLFPRNRDERLAEMRVRRST